jgi:hypothetical protein
MSWAEDIAATVLLVAAACLVGLLDWCGIGGSRGRSHDHDDKGMEV